MSNLFTTGGSRRTGGSFSVKCAGGAELVKRLRKLENGGAVAIKRTCSDFATRAPGWVSKGIREHYGVDTKAIKDAAQKPKRGQTTIKVAGVTVDGVTLKYEGRTLTPTHFKMSPKAQPKNQQTKPSKIPGQVSSTDSPVVMVNQPKPYSVKATIIKGQRVSLPAGTFIATAKGGVSLPFQRAGEKRMPIEAVRTLSVPQMIEGRAQATIEQTVSEKLGERFQHHINQATKV